MYSLTIPARELFDDKKQEFVQVTKETVLKLEHSLVSISKWESKWHKSFLDDTDGRTKEESLDYIRCMTITQNVDPNVYYAITSTMIQDINEYINANMTATTFGKDNRNKRPHKGPYGKPKRVTSELVYYWMIANNIPMECEKWHFSRLMTLIRVCEEKNAPPGKKKSERQLTEEYAALNRARLAKSGGRG